MKYKNISLLIVLLGTLVLIFGSKSVFAQSDPLVDVCTGEAFQSATCQGRTSGNPILGPDGIITKVSQILVIVAGVASVIMIIIGGFKYIISAGDASATKSARDTILYAVIGLVITVMAQAIVSLVLRKL